MSEAGKYCFDVALVKKKNMFVFRCALVHFTKAKWPD